MGGFRDSSPMYEQLPDDSVSAGMPRRKKPRAKWCLLVSLLVAWNIMLLPGCLYGLKTYFGTSELVTVKPVTCECGATIEEAVSMGCKYDTLSVSWLPPQCRDDELTAEFNHAGPGGEWHYWADRNMTQPLTIQQVSALAAKPIEEAQFWTTFGWHVNHCSFYWRKEYRMRERGFEMEHRYDRESHIKHCHMAFTSRTPLNVTNTQAAVGLGGDRVGGVRTESQKQHEQHDHQHEDEHDSGITIVG